MARRLSIVNQKGGVGKTTTCVNLAANLAARGKRVLLIDYDPQGNCTQFLGLAHLTEDHHTYGAAEFTMGSARDGAPAGANGFAPQRDILLHEAGGGEGRLDLLPATEELAFIEANLLTDVIAGARRLLAAVKTIEPEYDFIIADCAPTMSILLLNAVCACPEVLIPVKLSAASVPGALRLRRHIQEKLRHSVDPGIHIMGVLGTFNSDSARKPREILGALREVFGSAVFETTIHTNQAADDAAEAGVPVVLGKPGARAAIQYDQLTDEVLARAN
jgi:chromosome partitioning protein